ncbi:transposase [Aeromonas veronii]|uniref:transposase n=1 Tax=Aeromonas veronii TaxID=654 RepID=UPI0035B9526A
MAYRQPCKGHITDLVIDSTGLKVFGEGEWKVRKHGAEKRRVWRKLHLAVDPATHKIVPDGDSDSITFLNGVTKVPPITGPQLPLGQVF